MSDASSAIARAGSPTVCDSYERGSIDEPLRDRWLPVFESIVTAHVALQAGKFDAPEAAARSALAAVRAHPDPEPDLLAGALGALGLVQAERRQFTDARATLNEAIRLATHAREDKIVVDSWNAILLMGVRGDDKDVDAAIFGAEVAASRLPEDDPSRCMVAPRTLRRSRSPTSRWLARWCPRVDQSRERSSSRSMRSRSSPGTRSRFIAARSRRGSRHIASIDPGANSHARHAASCDERTRTRPRRVGPFGAFAHLCPRSTSSEIGSWLVTPPCSSVAPSRAPS